MKRFLLLLLLFPYASALLWAQNILIPLNAPNSEQSTSELATVEALAATIEGVFVGDNELINIARDREVTCKKIESDVPRFLRITGSTKARNELVEAAQEAPLLRLTLFSEQDIEQARTIDYSILEQLGKLKYLLFDVSLSMNNQQPKTEQSIRIESAFKALVKEGLGNARVKVFYRIIGEV